MAKLSVVGKSVPRIDGVEKVTGKAKFVSDYKMPGMLYGKILRSLYQHARIKSIDTSKAEKLPGVRTVVTGNDAPAQLMGQLLLDMYVLSKDNIVRCVGQPVAAVAAETIDIAEEAVDLIEVDYEELPAVFDAEEAMKKDAPVLHPDLANYFSPDTQLKRRLEPDMPNVFMHFKIRNGDVEKGFKEADLIIENRYSVPRIAHCQLETHRSMAWVEADGTVCVRTSTQQRGVARLNLARVFGLPPSKVRVMSPYVGGGFGGKTGTDTVLDPIAVLLAMKSGRPVFIELTREEMFIDGRQRQGIITYIKDGMKKDGTLVAREMRLIHNCGRNSDMSIIVVKNGTFGAVGTYRIPNFSLDSYGVYTNTPFCTPFRGLGTPEITWAIEQQMDILAEKLGISPVEIRKKNILKEGEKDVMGQTTVAMGVEPCLDKVAEWIELDKKPEAEGPWKKGKSIAIGNKYSTGATTSGATVKVYEDGVIEVRHGSDEIGQGVNTVMAQMVAEEFGVSVDKVRVYREDSQFCPFDFGAVSSRATFHVGNAVRRACQDAKRQIFEMAAPRLGAATSDLELREGNIYVVGYPGKFIKITDLFNFHGVPFEGGEILGTGSYYGNIILEDPDTGQSPKMCIFYAHGAHGVEVAVNTETGDVKVLRIAGAFDMGTPINPKMAEAQIEGGFGMGIGAAIYEECVIKDGVVVNPQFADYKVPGAMELPSWGNCSAMAVPTPHPEGPFGAKGLGEGALVPIAPAISNAIYNAVGIRIKDLPISREKVWKALREKGSS